MQAIEASSRLRKGLAKPKQGLESSASDSAGVESSCGMDEGASDKIDKATIKDQEAR